MFDYRLALATGVDIPIPELQTAIHQPTITEISMIGESDFFTGVQLLCVNKSMYIDDPIALSHTSNFELFMAMMNEKQLADKKASVLQVLTLTFPSGKVIFTPRSMLLNFGEANVIIDEGNFEILQKVLRDIFCLSKTDQDTFNPANQKAKEIANKIMKSRQKIAALKAESNSGSMFGQYLSILVIGTGTMSLAECSKLTMYQLYDLVERYTLYINWDLDIQSRLAGGKSDKPIENWMKNIHSN